MAAYFHLAMASYYSSKTSRKVFTSAGLYGKSMFTLQTYASGMCYMIAHAIWEPQLHTVWFEYLQ